MSDELHIHVTHHPAKITQAFQPDALTDHHATILDNLMVVFSLMQVGRLEDAQRTIYALNTACEACFGSMLINWAFVLGRQAGEDVIGEALTLMRQNIAASADARDDRPNGLSSPFTD